MSQKYDITQLNQIAPIATQIDQSSKKCVIGLNRDGVINELVDPYCYRIDQFIPIHGSIEAIALLRSKLYGIVIFTDQGGIEQGLYSTDDVDILHTHMLDLFGRAGCSSIDAIYYSASSRKDDPYAFPNTGMMKRCEKENKHIKFKNGYYVGTTIKDLKVATRLGAKPILIRHGKGQETEDLLNRFTYRELKKQTVIYNSFFEFVSNLS